MSSKWAKSAKGAKGRTRQMNTLLNLKNVTFDRRKKSSLPTYVRLKNLESGSRNQNGEGREKKNMLTKIPKATFSTDQIFNKYESPGKKQSS